jgi:hypothetical protein
VGTRQLEEEIMKLERRAEGASDRDQEILDTREPATPETTRLDAPEDPLRGMSDGEVLQRFELI